MILQDIPTEKLRVILADTERAAGHESQGAAMLRRELMLRQQQEHTRRRRPRVKGVARG